MKLTGNNTHKAQQRGYANSSAGGLLIEPGEFVPEGNPISQVWMIEADKYQGPVDDELTASGRLTPRTKKAEAPAGAQ